MQFPLFQSKHAKKRYLRNSCQSFNENLNHKQYKLTITPANNASINAKRYFHKNLPFTPEYLKMKQQAFQKYQEMRFKNRELKQLFSQENLNQKQINYKKCDSQLMENNLNMFDFKYPCIGYYELKGYKNPQKKSVTSTKYPFNRTSMEINKLRSISHEQKHKKEYKTVQSNHSLQKSDQFPHNQQNRSIKIISNILNKYNHRKKMSKKRENHNQRTFTFINFYGQDQPKRIATQQRNYSQCNKQNLHTNCQDTNHSIIEKDLVCVLQNKNIEQQLATIDDHNNSSKNLSSRYLKQTKIFKRSNPLSKFLLKNTKKPKLKKANLQNQNPDLQQI